MLRQRAFQFASQQYLQAASRLRVKVQYWIITVMPLLVNINIHYLYKSRPYLLAIDYCLHK
jgi:hypothetical protein